MPGRIYRVVEGIVIKRVLNYGGEYCNLNVFLANSYFQSDGREYLAVTPIILEEVVVMPQSELQRQVARLEELVELLTMKVNKNGSKGYYGSTPDAKVSMFVKWWEKWVGVDPTLDISQTQIGNFTGYNRITVNRSLARISDNCSVNNE